MLRKFFNNNPELKSPRELQLMREAGKLVAEAHRIAGALCKPGVKTIEIDRAVEALYASRGAVPLFKGYPGPRVPFPAVTCISINEQVVHGIPGQRAPQDGDLIKIDTACKLNGWCADAAVTPVVGEVRPQWRRLAKLARQALHIPIIHMGRHKWCSEVASQLQ